VLGRRRSPERRSMHAGDAAGEHEPGRGLRLSREARYGLSDQGRDHELGSGQDLLERLGRQPFLRLGALRILEIGSWEGRSALFFLNYLPLSRITCIDPFDGNIEHHINPYFAALALKSEAQFDANLAALADRIEKIKGSSKTVLPELGVAGRRFDFAYIDGSHRAADVYADAALTWPLMEPRDGLVLFDDYLWDGMDEEHELPKPGIDAFLAAIGGHYREVHRGYQLAIAKL
jgi:predicted O-methyltransferase YrrM